MFKIFPNGCAIDTTKVIAVDIENFGVKDLTYRIIVECTSGCELCVAEFSNDKEAAKEYLKKLVDELNAGANVMG